MSSGNSSIISARFSLLKDFNTLHISFCEKLIIILAISAAFLSDNSLLINVILSSLSADLILLIVSVCIYHHQ